MRKRPWRKKQTLNLGPINTDHSRKKLGGQGEADKEPRLFDKEVVKANKLRLKDG